MTNMLSFNGFGRYVCSSKFQFSHFWTNFLFFFRKIIVFLRFLLFYAIYKMKSKMTSKSRPLRDTLIGLIFASSSLREIFWIYFRERALLKVSRGFIFANADHLECFLSIFSLFKAISYEKRLFFLRMALLKNFACINFRELTFLEVFAR